MSITAANGIGSEQRLTGGTGPGAPAKPDANGKRAWSIRESERLYGISQWGQGYFSINEDGHVAVHPLQNPALAIDLKKLVDELRERDIALPILVRFTDILRH